MAMRKQASVMHDPRTAFSAFSPSISLMDFLLEGATGDLSASHEMHVYTRYGYTWVAGRNFF
jgi:hypothetical protein